MSGFLPLIDSTKWCAGEIKTWGGCNRQQPVWAVDHVAWVATRVKLPSELFPALGQVCGLLFSDVCGSQG